MINKLGPPKIAKVSKAVNEAYGIKTIFFNENISIKPGQFLMVWIPGIDEKPYAVSYHANNLFGITSHAIGRFSNKFNNLKKGDKVGLSGPYGKGFNITKNKKSCIVAGGIGFSSLATLANSLKKTIILAGFRTKNYIIYKKRFRNMKIATDDGSYGYHGFVTELFKEEIEKNEIEKNKFEVVYTCGPEIMMKKVLDICNKYNIECQASLERYMKCGFGVCGNCMCSDKIVCIDGPVFNSKGLRQMFDFGRYARLKSGKKVSLAGYFKLKD